MPEEPGVQTLINLVWQFGPFAFAIIFVFLLSRQCNAQYQKAVVRTVNPPSSAELWMYRSFFILAFVIGCGLSIYSVIWWSYAQNKRFVYEFSVRDVGPEFILKGVTPVIALSPPTDDGDGTATYSFVVVSMGPFKPNQKFILVLTPAPNALSGGMGLARRELSLAWSGNPEDHFKLSGGPGQLALQTE